MMVDHIIIDANRNPHQIRCLHCGFAQDLQLPIAITALAKLERQINAEHRRCKRPGPRLTEGPTARNNAGPGPRTPKPAIVPKPQPSSPRIIRDNMP